ncbi:MAG: thioredoxin domain-containing protein [Saprospiraceae bacterium]
MNRLQHESSPYLLQHANNPVDWYAWKPEAFEKARREDKPILVSIGYSTCHWCHVMERESFEDQEVAEFMNTHFVCIKVDREERPDVDQIYMEACQVLTGHGGWPLNVFLTPDLKPFYAGTYYPPMPAHGRPSWLQVLMNLSHTWQHHRKKVEDQAQRLFEIIEKSDGASLSSRIKVESDSCPFSEEKLHTIWRKLYERADKTHGGFEHAPKFPSTMALQYILAYHFYFGNAEALKHVERSLEHMAAGGIYDHLAGGFARYSTDAEWKVPHFEKMLYDNALLVDLYAEAWKRTRKESFRKVVEETLQWVSSEMTHPEGGFYSALDADSEGVEGKFYVWSAAEIDEVLGQDAGWFKKLYNVSTEGNWEGSNILFRTPAERTEQLPEVDEKKLKAAKARLLDARAKRVRPGLDDKILLGWNALMAKAMLVAFTAFGKEEYRQTALGALEFMLDKFLQPDGLKLYHTYKDGKASYEANLDDYAFLIDALLKAFEVTQNEQWLLQAKRYAEHVISDFLDDKDKLFYFTSAQQTDLPVRKKDFYDSATPSGNSTMVRNLQRLGILTGNEDYRRLATDMIFALRDSIGKFPSAFSNWALALMGEVKGYLEIAVVGREFMELTRQIQARYLPHAVLIASEGENKAYPLLENRTSADGDTLIYVCQDYTCQRPVRSIGEFDELILNQQRNFSN